MVVIRLVLYRNKTSCKVNPFTIYSVRKTNSNCFSDINNGPVKKNEWIFIVFSGDRKASLNSGDRILTVQNFVDAETKNLEKFTGREQTFLSQAFSIRKKKKYHLIFPVRIIMPIDINMEICRSKTKKAV